MGVQINGDTGNISATKADYSGNVTIGGTLTYEDVTNVDSVGLVTARNGIEVGARPGVAASISVDGNAIFSGITTIGGDAKVGSGVTLSPDGNIFTTGIATVSGNIDINGTPPWTVTGGNYRNLSISGNDGSSSGFIWLGNGAATTNADFDLGRINFNNGATNTSRITGSTDTSANDDGRIEFHTQATGGSLSERLRIGSSGQLGIAGANYGTSGQFLKSTGSGSAVQWASVGVSTSSLQVLEQFYLLADGRSVSTSNGTVTTTNVTTDPNLTDDFAEASGSSLTYHPPTGTTEIIYEYKFLIAENNSNDRYLVGYYVDIDGSEILESRSSRMGSAEYQDTIDVKYSFRVNTGGSNNATTGDRAGLTSMTIKTMVRRWASSYAAKLHFLQYYSGTSAVSIVRRPYVGITAIGSLS